MVDLIFFANAFLLIVASVMVITLRNPVRCALSLAMAFLVTSILWMLLQAEFLSLVLIFVYVGAVMTLILFVVMMLNIEKESIESSWVKGALLALPIILLMAIVLIHVFSNNMLHNAMSFHQGHIARSAQSLDNTSVLGRLLYGHYLYSFELAAFILLVSIIGSISLTLLGPRKGSKKQNISKQHQATKSSRLKMVTVPSESQEGGQSNG